MSPSRNSANDPATLRDSPEWWITKDEAAARLKVSLRTIETYISEGRLPSKKQQNPGRKPLTVVHAEDVSRVHAEEHQGVMLPAAPIAPVALMQSAVPMVREVLAELRAARPARQTPFLPMKEAAIYTGLPDRLLRRLIRERRIASETFGGTEYFKTSDLDAITFRVREEVE